ncbi:MAG: 7-cyano-7-deazaguanine synthase [Actinomycetota bacterium]|nr:7-cyano-7-deazaguanine synthase [Actinomycetota bacterium]
MPCHLVLLSAGLDSCVNFLMALENGGVGMAVTVDYGQRAACMEVKRANVLCESRGVEHMVIDCAWLGGISRDALTSWNKDVPMVEAAELERGSGCGVESVWVPNRNGLLANLGACVAEALGLEWVVMGLNAEEAEEFPDNSALFVERMNRVWESSTLTGVHLKSFTINWDKKDVLRQALALDLDFQLIWSCYNGEDLMCGRCDPCTRLLRAARQVGASDRIAQLFSRK